MESVLNKKFLNASSYPILSSLTGPKPYDVDIRAGLATLTSRPFLITAFVVYVCLCASLRFRFEKSTRKRFNFPDRASLARMTNAEAQLILTTIITNQFPFLYQTALQFAIFKVGLRGFDTCAVNSQE
jgi:hypothetical protein